MRWRFELEGEVLSSAATRSGPTRSFHRTRGRSLHHGMFSTSRDRRLPLELEEDLRRVRPHLRQAASCHTHGRADAGTTRRGEGPPHRPGRGRPGASRLASASVESQRPRAGAPGGGDRGCRICREVPHGNRWSARAAPGADGRAQAPASASQPGARRALHASGTPFMDPSGDGLRPGCSSRPKSSTTSAASLSAASAFPDTTRRAAIFPRARMCAHLARAPVRSHARSWS